MSIPPTELQDLMEAYYTTHVKVDTNKATIIQLETTQQSHDEEHATNGRLNEEKGLHLQM